MSIYSMEDHTNNPLAGGKKSASSSKCFEDYMAKEFCLSCAYFKQSKGHFGLCTVKPSIPYDGSKKGTGCLCWRVKTSLSDLELIQVKQIDKEPEITNNESLYQRLIKADKNRMRLS